MALGSWGLLLDLLKQELRHWVVCKGRQHWGSLLKGLNACFLPIVSIPGTLGLHFSPMNGDIWTQKNTFRFTSEQEINSDMYHVHFSSVSRALGFSAARLFFSNLLFPPSHPLVLCLGDPTVQEKSGGCFCLSPSSFYFLLENNTFSYYKSIACFLYKRHKMPLEKML